MDASSESDYTTGSDYVCITSEESQSDEEISLDGDFSPEELTSPENELDGSYVELPVDVDASVIDGIQADEGDIAAIRDAILQFSIDNPDHDRDDTGSDDEGVEPKLFNGNLAPPEFYRHNIRTLNVDDFRKKNYAKGTLKLIDNAESFWRSYVSALDHSLAMKIPS